MDSYIIVISNLLWYNHPCTYIRMEMLALFTATTPGPGDRVNYSVMERTERYYSTNCTVYLGDRVVVIYIFITDMSN